MKTLTVLEDADNLRFDVKTKLAYLGYADGALGIIDTSADKVPAKVPLVPTRNSIRMGDDTIVLRAQ